MRWVSRTHVLGLPGFPMRNKGTLQDKLRCLGVRMKKGRGNGGERWLVCLDDLPDEMHAAFAERERAEGLSRQAPPDIDAARQRYDAASPKVRRRAEEKAKALGFMDVEMGLGGVDPTAAAKAVAAQLGARGLGWRTIYRAWQVAGGAEPEARTWLLTADYGSEESPWNAEEVAFFDTVVEAMRRTYADYPFSAGWRKAMWDARASGEAEVSEARCRRRWNALTASQRTEIIHGKSGLRKHRPPKHRKKPDYAGSVFCLDARTVDVNVMLPNGEVKRPLMLAVEDVYSSKILAHTFALTDTEDAWRELLFSLWDEVGLPDVWLLDNSAAFAALAVGSVKDKPMSPEQEQRERSTRLLDRLKQPVWFAAAYNGQEKTIERRFRDFAASYEAGAFKDYRAYVGNHPGARSERNDGAVPWDVFTGRYADEVAKYNAFDGFDGLARPRRGEGQRGSFNATWEHGLAEREAAGKPMRRLTEAQWRLARMKPKFLKPHPETGRITYRNRLYFEPDTIEQTDKLLAARRASPDGKVIVWADPADYGAGALITDHANVVRIDRLPRAPDSEFWTEEQYRERQKRRQARLKAEKRAEEAAEAELEAEVRGLLRPEPGAPAPAAPVASAAKVVAPAFGAPVAKEGSPETAQPAEVSDQYEAFDALFRDSAEKKVAGQSR